MASASLASWVQASNDSCASSHVRMAMFCSFGAKVSGCFPTTDSALASHQPYLALHPPRGHLRLELTILARRLSSNDAMSESWILASLEGSVYCNSSMPDCSNGGRLRGKVRPVSAEMPRFAECNVEDDVDDWLVGWICDAHTRLTLLILRTVVPVTT